MSVLTREIQLKIVATFLRKTYECGPGRVGPSCLSSGLVVLIAGGATLGLRYLSGVWPTTLGLRHVSGVWATTLNLRYVSGIWATTLGLRHVSDGHLPNKGNRILSKRPPQVSPTPVEIGVLTLTTVETNKARRMAEKVNRIMTRGTGGIELAGVLENAGKPCSTSSLYISSCIGNRQVFVRGVHIQLAIQINRQSLFHRSSQSLPWKLADP